MRQKLQFKVKKVCFFLDCTCTAEITFGCLRHLIFDSRVFIFYTSITVRKILQLFSRIKIFWGTNNKNFMDSFKSSYTICMGSMTMDSPNNNPWGTPLKIVLDYPMTPPCSITFHSIIINLPLLYIAFL